MKIFWLILSTLLFLNAPVIAAEYQGKNLDGRKLAAKAYYQKTGGVYDVQVEFKKDLAILYFTDGSQVTLKLGGQRIADPSNIVGYGRLGYIPLNNRFSIGLESSNSTDDIGVSSPNTVGDIWRIQLDPNTL
jgi:hypothetical protein